MVLFNFLNFFALLFEIFYSRSSSKGRNEKFFFLSFSTCADLFSLEMKPEWCFLIFWIFLPFFFGIFYSGSSRTDRNNNCFFSLSRPVPTRFGLKWSLNCPFLFFVFICFFFGIFYSWSSRTDRNDNFLFLSFVTCPNPFWP